MGYEPYECSSEDEARKSQVELEKKGKWPCLFTDSDTTGEKDFEEFYVEGEQLDMDRFQSLGVVKNDHIYEHTQLEHFVKEIKSMRRNKQWSKQELVELFKTLIPNFSHKETGKYLDAKM